MLPTPVPRFRQLLLFAMTAMVLIFGAYRLSFVTGLRQQARVTGGSMADAFFGEHYLAGCSDCGFPLRFDANDPPAVGRIVCPNCGFDLPPTAEVRRVGGERVLLDAWPIGNRNLSRWQAVALATPDQANHLSVKRIIGLPGERVVIRHGDIYIDDRVQRKSLDQLRSTAILVHDNAFRPRRSANLPSRWQADEKNGGWRIAENEIYYDRLDRARSDASFEFQPFAQFDWLSYRHWRCVASPLPRDEETPVLDNYGYNQNLSRQLNRVTDLMLVADLAIDGDSGRIAFRIDDGRDRFVVVLEPDLHVQLVPHMGTGTVYRNDALLATFDLPPAAYAREFRIELAQYDHRLAVAIDGATIFRLDYTPASHEARRTTRPLAIGADLASVRIDRLRVFRDVHSLSPHGVDMHWRSPRPLGDHEIFVLGDNVPISLDSRHWPTGVGQDRILGVVRSWR